MYKQRAREQNNIHSRITSILGYDEKKVTFDKNIDCKESYNKYVQAEEKALQMHPTISGENDGNQLLHEYIRLRHHPINHTTSFHHSQEHKTR